MLKVAALFGIVLFSFCSFADDKRVTMRCVEYSTNPSGEGDLSGNEALQSINNPESEVRDWIEFSVSSSSVFNCPEVVFEIDKRQPQALSPKFELKGANQELCDFESPNYGWICKK